MASADTRTFVRVVCAIALLLVAGVGSAATITSNAGFGLDWNSPATWQGNTVPTAADDVIIAAGSGVNITAASTVTVNSVSLQGGNSPSPSQSATLTVDGTLTAATITATGGTPGGTATLTAGGTVNVTTLNIIGGAGSALGTGGAATLSMLNPGTAVNVSGNANVNVTLGAYTGGAATIDFPSASGGTLDINGNLTVNSGTINLNNGALNLAGDFSGDFGETINRGSASTVTFDGTTHQQWSGNSVLLHNVVIANPSNSALDEYIAVAFDGSLAVYGTLTLQGGNLAAFPVNIQTVNGGLTRTSGYITSGALFRNVTGATQTVFPVGAGALYLPVTVTPSSTGQMSVQANQGTAWGAGANSLDVHWLINGDGSTLTNLTGITFNYAGATVTGNEASYVIARQDFNTQLWHSYATSLNAATDTATMSVNAPVDGYWTLGEPSSVTSATQLVLTSINDGQPLRRNTPFDLVYEARDANGNPATFSAFHSFELSVGGTPTGTLTDIDGNLAPIGADAFAGDSTILIPNLIYTASETVNLVLTEASDTPVFATVTTPVTFGLPATQLTVTSTEDEGIGTLRRAIHTANAGGCAATPCPINFQLPLAEQELDGTWKITVSSFANATIAAIGPTRDSFSPMPSISAAVILDATTQSGYNPANPRPVVTIDGGNGSNILTVDGQGSTIRGLALHNTGAYALVLQGTGSHVVEGCHLGLDAAGNAANDTWGGIAITSNGNKVGGDSAAARNVISGNDNNAIEILNGASQNTIAGNYIGTDRTGTTAVANYIGVYIGSASSNTIGGTQPGEGNVIAGNTGDGIYIDGTSNNNFAQSGGTTAAITIYNAAENRIHGNSIGYNAAGAELLNAGHAVQVLGDSAYDNLVGGPSLGEGNSIAGGVQLGGNSVGTAVLGNTIDITAQGITIAGFTGNDPGDADVNAVACTQPPCVFANNGQNKPVISAATLAGTTLSVTLGVDSASVQTTQSIRVEVFSADAGGTLSFIGNGCYNTNFVNSVTINVPNAGVAAGDLVYATATSFDAPGCQINDAQGNYFIGDGTSQLSDPVAVTSCAGTTPTITASGPTTFCSGGSVTLTASAGASFSWKKNGVLLNAFSQQLVVNASGNYSVVVTDVNGCPAESAATTVTVNPAAATPTVTAGGPTTFCAGGSVMLTSSAAASYQWLLNGSPIQNANLQSFSAGATGSYSVTITNANGCSATSAPVSVTVNNATPPTVTAGGPTTFCQGGSVTLTSSAAASYQWLLNGSPIQNASLRSFNAGATGNYSVTITDANGCTATSAPVSVTVTNVAPPAVTTSGPTTFCAGGSVVLTSSAGASYQWLLNGSPIQNANLQSFSAGATGNYSVTTTDANGCAATSAPVSVSVHQVFTPTVTASGPTTFCPGGSVTLTSSASASYQWLLNGGPIPNATAQTFVANATGNYSVTTTDGNGCSATSSPVAVNVSQTAATPTITPSGPTTFCAGGNVVLTSSPAASYQWLLNGNPIQNANGQTFTAGAGGNYSVTITDGGGCTATSAPTTVTVNPTPPAPTVTPNGPTTFCTGGSVTLTSSPAAQYQWLLGGSPIQNATAQTFVATATGSYSVTIKDANGCAATSTPVSVSANQTAATPTVTPNGPTTFCTGGSVVLTSSPAAGYQWLLGGSPIQNATAQTFTATAGGNYSVTITDGSGCTATSAPLTVTVTSPPAPTVTANGPTTFCQGGSVTLTSSATTGTYQWLENGAPINGANGQSYVATAAGDYTVTITENGCPATSAPVTINTTGFTPTLNAPSTTLCAGGSITLSASTGTSYQWYFNSQPISGANGQTFNATQPGDYKVFVESNGCSNFTAPVTITQGAGTAPAVSASGPTTFCDGGQVTLTSTAAQSYQWSRNGLGIANATQQTYVATISGSYTVTTTSAGGCVATSAPVSVTVTPQPLAGISAPASVQPGSTNNIAAITDPQPSASYTWSITGGTIDGNTGGTSITFTAGTGSSVILTVTATIGNCTATATRTVAIADPGADLAVTKTAPASVQTGGTIDYTITVTNNGPSAAVNVFLNDPLPAGTTFVGVQSSWNCALISGAVFCRAFSLNPDAAETIHITLTAPQQAGTITNTASAGSSSNDPNPGNDSASATTSVTSSTPTCATEPPQPLVPGNGDQVTSPVTFHWTAVNGAVGYELWTLSGAAPAIAGTTTGTSLTLPLPTGRISWYVVARLGSGCDALTSARRDLTIVSTGNCANNGTPQLTAPAPGTTVASPVAFSWTSAANAIGYRVWISVDGGALQDIGSTTGATTLTAPVPPGAIVAFVDALFSGCDPKRSPGAGFTVPRSDPCSSRAIVAPVSPANNAIVQSSSIDFDWSPAAGAKEYRLWAIIDGSAPAVLGTTTETALRVTIPRGEVTWWIESLYTGCASTESPRVRFTIPAAQNCGTARPEGLNAVVGNGIATFSWGSVAGAIGYEVWLAHNDGTPSLIGTTTATTFTAEVPAGELDWFVRVLVDRCPPRDSQTASFTFTPPAACDDNIRPVPVSPLDRSEAVSPLEFSWGGTGDATKFEVYVVRGNAAPQLVATTDGDTYRVSNIALANGAVSWFVRAHFGSACPPLDSAEQQLQIVPRPEACATPEAPVLAAPGQVSADQFVIFQWTPIPAATSYQLQVATNPDFTGAEVITTAGTEHQVIRNQNQLVTFYARVRAVNSRCGGAAQVGPYSATVTVFVLPLGTSNGGTSTIQRGVVLSQIPLGPELAGQSFTATPSHSFLMVNPASGIVPPGGTVVNVFAVTATLPVGTSIGSVTITLSAPGGGRIGTNATPVVVPVSVNLVTPVSPTPKNTPPPDALIIPAVAHAAGINSQFQSDIRVSNTSPQVIKYQVTFTPSGEAGITAGRQTTFSIDPGRTVALDDVLKSWFGTGDASVTGTLEVRPLTQTATSTSSAAFGALANLVTFASSRTFNITPNGTFGQYIPAIPFANFIGRSDAVLSLQQIAHSAKYRTNLGLVEASGEPASLLVKVFGPTGSQLAQFPVNLNGGQHLQLNSFIAQQGISSLDDGRVEVQVTGGNGKVTAYASVLDNATSDPLLVTPITLKDAGNSKWVIPGVADLSNGIANWQSDVRLFNAGSASTTVTLSFVSMNGGEPKSATITLQPGEVRQLDRVLSIFGVSQDGGALHIQTAAPARLIATARTYNQTTQGTYGQFISAVTPSESVGVGSRPLQLLQVEESSRYRSNIGLAEVTGKPVTLEVSVVPPDAKFTATTRVTLAPNEFRQIGSMLASLGLGETYNARITVKAVAGEGRATAYASVIDLKTQDPTYVPAQ